jgi:hypothetical protein
LLGASFASHTPARRARARLDMLAAIAKRAASSACARTVRATRSDDARVDDRSTRGIDCETIGRARDAVTRARALERRRTE